MKSNSRKRNEFVKKKRERGWYEGPSVGIPQYDAEEDKYCPRALVAKFNDENRRRASIAAEIKRRNASEWMNTTLLSTYKSPQPDLLVSKSLDSLLREQDSKNSKEVEILQNITVRENLLKELIKMLNSQTDIHSILNEIVEFVKAIRFVTIDIVQEISRCQLQGYIVNDFLYKGENYIVKVANDLSFLDNYDDIIEYFGFHFYFNPLAYGEGGILENPIMSRIQIDTSLTSQKVNHNYETSSPHHSLSSLSPGNRSLFSNTNDSTFKSNVSELTKDQHSNIKYESSGYFSHTSQNLTKFSKLYNLNDVVDGIDILKLRNIERIIRNELERVQKSKKRTMSDASTSKSITRSVHLSRASLSPPPPTSPLALSSVVNHSNFDRIPELASQHGFSAHSPSSQAVQAASRVSVTSPQRRDRQSSLSKSPSNHIKNRQDRVAALNEEISEFEISCSDLQEQSEALIRRYRAAEKKMKGLKKKRGEAIEMSWDVAATKLAVEMGLLSTDMETMTNELKALQRKQFLINQEVKRKQLIVRGLKRQIEEQKLVKKVQKELLNFAKEKGIVSAVYLTVSKSAEFVDLIRASSPNNTKSKSKVDHRESPPPHLSDQGMSCSDGLSVDPITIALETSSLNSINSPPPRTLSANEIREEGEDEYVADLSKVADQNDGSRAYGADVVDSEHALKEFVEGEEDEEEQRRVNDWIAKYEDDLNGSMDKPGPSLSQLSGRGATADDDHRDKEVEEDDDVELTLQGSQVGYDVGPLSTDDYFDTIYEDSSVIPNKLSQPDQLVTTQNLKRSSARKSVDKETGIEVSEVEKPNVKRLFRHRSDNSVIPSSETSKGVKAAEEALAVVVNTDNFYRNKSLSEIPTKKEPKYEVAVDKLVAISRHESSRRRLLDESRGESQDSDYVVSQRQDGQRLIPKPQQQRSEGHLVHDPGAPTKATIAKAHSMQAVKASDKDIGTGHVTHPPHFSRPRSREQAGHGHTASDRPVDQSHKSQENHGGIQKTHHKDQENKATAHHFQDFAHGVSEGQVTDPKTDAASVKAHSVYPKSAQGKGDENQGHRPRSNNSTVRPHSKGLHTVSISESSIVHHEEHQNTQQPPSKAIQTGMLHRHSSDKAKEQHQPRTRSPGSTGLTEHSSTHMVTDKGPLPHGRQAQNTGVGADLATHRQRASPNSSPNLHSFVDTLSDGQRGNPDVDTGNSAGHHLHKRKEEKADKSTDQTNRERRPRSHGQGHPPHSGIKEPTVHWQGDPLPKTPTVKHDQGAPTKATIAKAHSMQAVKASSDKDIGTGHVNLDRRPASREAVAHPSHQHRKVRIEKTNDLIGKSDTTATASSVAGGNILPLRSTNDVSELDDGNLANESKVKSMQPGGEAATKALNIIKAEQLVSQTAASNVAPEISAPISEVEEKLQGSGSEKYLRNEGISWEGEKGDVPIENGDSKTGNILTRPLPNTMVQSADGIQVEQIEHKRSESVRNPSPAAPPTLASDVAETPLSIPIVQAIDVLAKDISQKDPLSYNVSNDGDNNVNLRMSGTLQTGDVSRTGIEEVGSVISDLKDADERDTTKDVNLPIAALNSAIENETIHFTAVGSERGNNDNNGVAATSQQQAENNYTELQKPTEALDNALIPVDTQLNIFVESSINSDGQHLDGDQDYHATSSEDRQEVMANDFVREEVNGANYANKELGMGSIVAENNEYPLPKDQDGDDGAGAEYQYGDQLGDDGAGAEYQYGDQAGDGGAGAEYQYGDQAGDGGAGAEYQYGDQLGYDGGAGAEYQYGDQAADGGAGAEYQYGDQLGYDGGAGAEYQYGDQAGDGGAGAEYQYGDQLGYDGGAGAEYQYGDQAGDGGAGAEYQYGDQLGYDGGAGAEYQYGDQLGYDGGAGAEYQYGDQAGDGGEYPYSEADDAQQYREGYENNSHGENDQYRPQPDDPNTVYSDVDYNTDPSQSFANDSSLNDLQANKDYSDMGSLASNTSLVEAKGVGYSEESSSQNKPTSLVISDPVGLVVDSKAGYDTATNGYEDYNIVVEDYSSIPKPKSRRKSRSSSIGGSESAAGTAVSAARLRNKAL